MNSNASKKVLKEKKTVKRVNVYSNAWCKDFTTQLSTKKNSCMYLPKKSCERKSM